ncbi:hypothetical protein OZX67_09315 [Bifidobacterium sp. ESL0728]|uniref:hypothetical protein n=1 Tax=Bifidobacterium sp. ESL0728 TaxID=2983220 RepID=UPI0023F82A0E|nr:hypothetical protein [Bifidobacterium sp. ESL0728]WEV58965.1 hypothetical protein OZX67_09315 [Bifidobacterium sp. ESL0728]
MDQTRLIRQLRALASDSGASDNERRMARRQLRKLGVSPTPPANFELALDLLSKFVDKSN